MVRILTHVNVELRKGLGYGLGYLGFECLQRQGIYAFSEGSRPDMGLSQPGDLSLGVKRLRRDAVHSPPPTTEVKKGWNHTFAPSARLHGVCRDYFFLSDGLRNGTLTFVVECLCTTSSDTRLLTFACRACCVIG